MGPLFTNHHVSRGAARTFLDGFEEEGRGGEEPSQLWMKGHHLLRQLWNVSHASCRTTWAGRNQAELTKQVGSMAKRLNN